MKTSHGLPIKLREYIYYCSSTSMGVPRDNMSSTQKKKKKAAWKKWPFMWYKTKQLATKHRHLIGFCKSKERWTCPWITRRWWIVYIIGAPTKLKQIWYRKQKVEKKERIAFDSKKTSIHIYGPRTTCLTCHARPTPSIRLF